MLLIADTSPLISLICIRQFELLPKLYPDFVIPGAVMDELTSHLEMSSYVKEISVLQKHTRKVEYEATKISDELGKGETEAILLYQKLQADLLLIDDKKARMIAETHEIQCIGTLGLLYKAKNNGLITKLKPLFRELVAKKRYYSEPLLKFSWKRLTNCDFCLCASISLALDVSSRFRRWTQKRKK